MSEIKFACPHCSQHIACDRGYAKLCIACPSCGEAMVVPVLSETAASHPAVCLVASLPSPRRRAASYIPSLDLWTEAKWEEHPGLASGRTPLWFISALLALVVAAILKAMDVGAGWIILTALTGGVVSGLFKAKGITLKRHLADDTDAGSLLAGTVKTVLGIGLLMLAIPALLLGLLFLGCAAISFA